MKEPVRGLLNLPDLVTADCMASAAIIQLRGAPSNSAPAAGSLQQPKPCELMVRRPGPGAMDELPTAESGYELPAAIVLQREGPWFRIALQQGSAWIQRANPDDFLPYPGLLQDRLTYLGMGWDGRLWESPGASDVRPVPAAWRSHLSREIPIEFLGSRQVGGQTWIHVRLDPSDRCGEELEGVSPLAGWIPAYRPSGAPSAWFYSRGC